MIISKKTIYSSRAPLCQPTWQQIGGEVVLGNCIEVNLTEDKAQVSPFQRSSPHMSGVYTSLLYDMHSLLWGFTCALLEICTWIAILWRSLHSLLSKKLSFSPLNLQINFSYFPIHLLPEFSSAMIDRRVEKSKHKENRGTFSFPTESCSSLHAEQHSLQRNQGVGIICYSNMYYHIFFKT